jgi:hypothetical protein
MKHFLELKPPLKALILSGLAEAAFLGVFFAFRDFSYFGTPRNRISQAFCLFHEPIGKIADDAYYKVVPDWIRFYIDWDNPVASWALITLLGLAQWYIILLPIIWIYRYLAAKLSRKPI